MRIQTFYSNLPASFLTVNSPLIKPLHTSSCSPLANSGVDIFSNSSLKFASGENKKKEVMNEHAQKKPKVKSKDGATPRIVSVAEPTQTDLLNTLVSEAKIGNAKTLAWLRKKRK